MNSEKITGYDELCLAVESMGWWNCDFVYKFTSEELLQLYRINRKTGWDIYPDQWEERQVQEALKLNKVPQWKYTSDEKVVAVYK